MNNLPIRRARHVLLILASLSLFVGFPLASDAYGADPVKKVKVKDHKVKVKAVGGKAKIKNKPNGKHKVKVKGPNGDLAAAVAQDAAGYPSRPTGYYYK